MSRPPPEGIGAELGREARQRAGEGARIDRGLRDWGG